MDRTGEVAAPSSWAPGLAAQRPKLGSPLTCLEEPSPKGAEMSAIDEFLRNNEAFAEGFDKGDLPLPPAKKVAIVACMDARLNPYPLLGLSIGDAHVIRNAGGVI